jgi:hypothetical protein
MSKPRPRLHVVSDELKFVVSPRYRRVHRSERVPSPSQSARPVEGWAGRTFFRHDALAYQVLGRSRHG